MKRKLLRGVMAAVFVYLIITALRARANRA
ncbi:hypothetical protein BH20ACT3_BH20ACT3_08150 [soil metagenome]